MRDASVKIWKETVISPAQQYFIKTDGNSQTITRGDFCAIIKL